MKKQQGSISVFMLIMLVAMLLFAGWVIDVIRSYSLHTQLSYAADAGLSSAVFSDEPLVAAEQLATANLNSGVALDSVDQLDVQYVENDLKYGITISAPLMPNSLNTIQQDPVPLSAEAALEINAKTAEIVFMLDVSASMEGEPIQKTKQALSAFGEMLFANSLSAKQYAISVVPASGNVNTGSMEHIYLGKIRTHDHAVVKRENRWVDMFDKSQGARPGIPGRDRNAMCRDITYEGNNPGTLSLRYFRNIEKKPQLAEANSRRIIRPIRRPSVGVFSNGVPLDPAVYPSTNPAHSYLEFREDKAIFDDIECHVNPIEKFVTNARELKKIANQLTSGMNTNNAEGMVWAARLLSPYWRGEWDKKRKDLPRNYGDENNKKFVIIFTDGEHLIAPGFRDKKMKLICRQLKVPSRGATIITVNFGGRASERLMRQCSSGPEYYHEASLFNVEHVFEKIAQQVVESTLVRK